MTHFEQSVIGSVLLTNGKALESLSLAPADFDDLQNERIYKTMLEMKANRQPIDVLTVGAALPKLASYLHDIVTATPTAASVNFYASKVIEEATRRRLAVAGTMIHSKAQHEDLATVFDTAKKEIDDLIDRNSAVKPSYVADELLAYMDEIDRPKNYPLSPWPLLNDIIGGFRPGALYIVGARPGVGKTIVGLQIAWELSKTGAVSFHSLEMGKHELYNRIVASQAEVYLGNIEKGNLKEWEWERILKVRTEIQSHKLAIHDKSGQNLLQIRAQANSVK